MSKISDTLNTITDFSNNGDPHWCTSNREIYPKSEKLGISNVKIEYDFSEMPIIKETNEKKHGEEVVKSPKHYHPRVSDEKMKYIIDRINKRGYIEVIDVIDAWNLDFPTGSAVKYELRLGEKDDELTEIDKAIEYLNFKKEMILSERK